MLEFGVPRVVVATGAHWRADGVGRSWARPMPIAADARVLTPDNIMDGTMPSEGTRVVVWDDDHFYMGGVIAELLADHGCETHYLTPASEASTWTQNTMEQHFIQARLLEKGVTIPQLHQPRRGLGGLDHGLLRLHRAHGGDRGGRGGAGHLARAGRPPSNASLRARADDWKDAGIETVTTIGDALAPATIAHAVYAGRRYAEDLDGPAVEGDDVPFRARDRRAPAPRLIETLTTRGAPRSGTRYCRRGP